jgi:hypothetical protein
MMFNEYCRCIDTTLLYSIEQLSYTRSLSLCVCVCVCVCVRVCIYL